MERKRNKRKESFQFRTGWHEVLRQYPGQVRLEVYDAIVLYAATGQETPLKPQARMAFDFIRRDIDRQAMEEGRDRKKQLQAQPPGSGRKGRSRNEGPGSGRRDGNGEFPSDGKESRNEATSSGFFQLIKRHWNNTCAAKGLSRVLDLTPRRCKLLRRQLADMHRMDGRAGLLEMVADLFRTIARTPFLLGANKLGWRASFDWVFARQNWLRILEGTYDSKKRRYHDDYDQRKRERLRPRTALATAASKPMPAEDDNWYWEELCPGGARILRYHPC